MTNKRLAKLSGDPVEGWKLSDSHMQFQKKLKQLNKAKVVLQFLSEQERQRQMTLQDAWRQLMISYDGLAQSAPETPLRNSQGMEFSEGPRAAEQQGPQQQQNPQQQMIRY